MTTRRTNTNRKPVADICLYGTSHIGAGYLGVTFPHGQTFGTGEGLYADQLGYAFTSITGLETSLGTMGARS